MQSLLPRLAINLNETEIAEQRARWFATYEDVRARRDVLAERFTDYEQLVDEIVHLIKSAAELQIEIDSVNFAGGPGTPRICSVEEHARGVTELTLNPVSITARLVLPDFLRPTENVWPPPVKIDTEALFAPIPFDPKFSGDWWRAGEQARQERAEQQAVEAKNAERERDAFYGRSPPAAN